MEVSVTHNGKKYKASLKHGTDLSIPIRTGKNAVNAYYANPVSMQPFTQGNWIGEVAQGGSVNYRNIGFNPHGNGTHTECVGHIDKTIHSVNKHFKTFHMVAQVISVTPVRAYINMPSSEDKIITKEQLKEQYLPSTEGVIIRTLPNDSSKKNRNYSGSNPPYLEADAVKFLVENGCKHLILDLPSVDREEDEGKLLGHKAFWNYPKAPRMDCTITELAFIPNKVKDGLYLLNLQVAPFENDAAPSRPVIFSLQGFRYPLSTSTFAPQF